MPELMRGPRPLPVAPPFRQIFERESSYVLNSLRRLGVRDRDLEDVAHDVFLAVFQRLSDFDAQRPLRPWLFGFAFREASNYRRSGRHRFESELEAPEMRDSAPVAEERLLVREQQRLVVEALDTLDFDRRAVLVMHDIDGQTMPEVARVLAIPLNTAYSRLRLAREDFRAALRRSERRRGTR